MFQRFVKILTQPWRVLKQPRSPLDSGEQRGSLDPSTPGASSFKVATLELFSSGNAALQIQDIQRAEYFFKEALVSDPTFVSAHCNLGAMYRDAGRISEAERHLLSALELDSMNSVAAFNLAMIRIDVKQWKEASNLLQRALTNSREKSDVYYWLGNSLMGCGDAESAQKAYESAFRLKPNFSSARWGYVMSQLSPIAEDDAHQKEDVLSFSAQIKRLKSWTEKHRKDIHDTPVGSQQPFYLAYIPGNHREVLAFYGALCSNFMQRHAKGSDLALKGKSANRKVRVGIVSAHIVEHSVWHALVRGWVEHLNREEIDVHVFHVGSTSDSETRWVARRVKEFHMGQMAWQDWAAKIKNTRVDVLLYPEVGMDSTTLRLASQRLARHQFASWGHPITTGLPTIDSYITAQAFESSDSPTAYTESLIILNGLGACYKPYDVRSSTPDLGKWGITKSDRLLICAGTPMKYRPHHDTVWAAIAQRCEGAKLIFFRKQDDPMSEKLERRLRKSFSKAKVDFDESVCFVPWLTQSAFFGLLRQADVYLDTIEFSGFNTTMQAIESETPIVAFEGKYLRGRFASGILRLLGLNQWVAKSTDEYIALVSKLVANSDARKDYRTSLSNEKMKLFNDKSSVVELSNILIDKARRTM